jgi:hypothetical protein
MFIGMLISKYLFFKGLLKGHVQFMIFTDFSGFEGDRNVLDISLESLVLTSFFLLIIDT